MSMRSASGRNWKEIRTNALLVQDYDTHRTLAASQRGFKITSGSRLAVATVSNQTCRSIKKGPTFRPLLRDASGLLLRHIQTVLNCRLLGSNTRFSSA